MYEENISQEFRLKNFISKHLFWWTRLEDIWKALFIFCLRRRLDQDHYICRSHTSSRRLDQDKYIRLAHTSSRRLPDVLLKLLQDIFKTSSKRFENVFKMSSRHLQEIFKTYHQVKLFLLTCLWDIFTFLRRTAKTVRNRTLSM